MIRFADSPAGTLWIKEAAKRISITWRVAARILKPVAWLEAGSGRRWGIYTEQQLDEASKQIAIGRIRIQVRSLKAKQRGVFLAEPR
jgi:hypothetical protein